MTPNTEDPTTNAVPKKPLAASASSRQNPSQQDVNRETRHARKRTRQGTTPPQSRHQAFAEKLDAAMNEKHLKPAALAKKVWGTVKDSRGYDVGRNRDRIGHYLNGTSYPNPENLKRIAEALDTTVEELAVEQPPRAVTSSRNSRPRGTRLSIIAAHDRSGWVDLEVSRRVPSEVAMQIWLLLTEVERNGDNGDSEQDEPPLGSVITGNK